MNDEIIESILSKVNNSKEYIFDLDNCSPFGVAEYTKTFFFMADELKLIRIESNKRNTFIVTELGYKVIKNGGWVKYLQKEKESEDAKIGNEKFEFLGKKWTYKSRLLPYLISLISAVFSFYVYITNSTKHKEIQLMKQEIQTLKIKMNKQDSLFPENNHQKNNILKP